MFTNTYQTEQFPAMWRQEQQQRHVPVTILQISGVLDATTYQELVARAAALCGAGTSNLVVDLQGVSDLRLSGLVALYSIARLVCGEAPLDPEAGWDALHALAREVERGVHAHLVLLAPQPPVALALAQSGIDRWLRVYHDLNMAIAALESNRLCDRRASTLPVEPCLGQAPPIARQRPTFGRVLRVLRRPFSVRPA